MPFKERWFLLHSTSMQPLFLKTHVSSEPYIWSFGFQIAIRPTNQVQWHSIERFHSSEDWHSCDVGVQDLTPPTGRRLSELFASNYSTVQKILEIL